MNLVLVKKVLLKLATSAKNEDLIINNSYWDGVISDIKKTDNESKLLEIAKDNFSFESLSDVCKPDNVELSESELSNDFDVYWDYLYVCDGKVIRSDIQGTVADLKRDLRLHYKLEAKVITNCDIEGRRKQAQK